MFTLLNLESSELVSRAQFASGNAASRAARLLTAKTGRKYRPRKVTAPVNWQARERSRFESGEYVPLHPELAALAPESMFAHTAKKSPSLIAYTKDELKGAADKQSLISIAAFVELVAPLWADNAKVALIQLQQEHANVFCSPLRFARTENEIESVYTNYDSDYGAVSASCMRYDARQFASRVNGRPYHPTRVYAAGDLAIAYLANEDGETIARALVWPDRKLYSRLYCGEDSTLSRLLQAQGYRGSGYYGGPSMRGAKLLRVETDCGGLVAPYLDEIGSVDDRGDYLVLDGDIDAQETNGVISRRPEFTCENCEEGCDESDTRVVYINGAMTRSQSWCEHCARNHAFYCVGYDEYFSDDVDADTMDGQTYSLHWLERNATRCERSDDWCDETFTVIVDEHGNTEDWSFSARQEDAFEYAGDWYSADVDFETVIVARDKLTKHYWRAIVWLKDETIRIPRFLIAEAKENDAPLCFEASDGRYYSPDYVDCYPLDRPRFVSAENGQLILPAIAA